MAVSSLRHKCFSMSKLCFLARYLRAWWFWTAHPTILSAWHYLPKWMGSSCFGGTAVHLRKATIPTRASKPSPSHRPHDEDQGAKTWGRDSVYRSSFSSPEKSWNLFWNITGKYKHYHDILYDKTLTPLKEKRTASLNIGNYSGKLQNTFVTRLVENRSPVHYTHQETAKDPATEQPEAKNAEA